MNVLIIGGTRFLGVAIVKELLSRGHSVTVFHRGKTVADLPASVQHFYGDAHTPDSLIPVLENHRFDAVIDTILSAEDLEWVLPAAQRFAGQLIHCGSTGVYAPAAYVPSREDDPTPCPPELGGFGTKLAQDEVLLRFYEKTHFKVCSLRVSNVFGAGDVPLDGLGGRDPNYFQAIANSEEVWLPLDGRALLQPVHTSDLARGFCAAVETDKTAGEIYNLSSERAVTLNHYVHTIKMLLGSASPIRHVSIEEALTKENVFKAGLLFVVEHMCIDSSKALRDFGYIPRVNLEEGLIDSLRWMITTGKLRVDPSQVKFSL